MTMTEFQGRLMKFLEAFDAFCQEHGVEWAKLFKWHGDSLKMEQEGWPLTIGFKRELELASLSRLRG